MHDTYTYVIYRDIFINLTGGAAPPTTFSGGKASPSPQTPPPEFHEGQALQIPHTENIGLT